MQEQGFLVHGFNAGVATKATDFSGEWRFSDLRSAGWWHLRDLLDPSRKLDVKLPPDDMLIADLTTPRWTPVSGGKIKVESKKDFLVRLKRSTDRGDAVVHAFALDIILGASWTGEFEVWGGNPVGDSRSSSYNSKKEDILGAVFPGD